MAEMLVQSTEDEIHLLPALPDAWKDGSVKGLCARGGLEIAMEWKDKVLRSVTVTAKVDGKTTLINGNKSVEIELKKGERSEHVW